MQKRVKWWKIAMACFIGGAVCTVIGLSVDPGLAWLGTLAGFLAGYVAYEFREVLNAIPEALEMSNAGLCRRIELIVRWGRERHPFIYLSFLAGYGMTLYGRTALLKSHITERDANNILDLVGAFSFLVFLCVLWIAALVAIAIATAIGQGMQGMEAPISPEGRFWDCKDERTGEIRSMTYRDFLKCFLTGSMLSPFMVIGWVVADSLKFIFYWFWVWLIRFSVGLFQSIHSEERMCCGVYGAFGGTLTFLYGILFMSNRTWKDVVFLTFCGGLIGAFTGTTIGRKLISIIRSRVPAEAKAQQGSD